MFLSCFDFKLEQHQVLNSSIRKHGVLVILIKTTGFIVLASPAHQLSQLTSIFAN